MPNSQMRYYDQENGWQALPGFAIQKFTLRDEIPKDTLHAAGVRFTSHVVPVRTDMRIVRFDNYLITRIRTKAIGALWYRSRSPARRRWLVIFLERGMVRVGENILDAGRGGAIAVVEPGGTPVDLEALEETVGVIFTFDARELGDYQIRDFAAKDFTMSAVLNPIYASLSWLADELPFNQQPASDIIRGLLRTFADGILQTFSSPVGPVTDLYREFRILVDRRFRSSTFAVSEAVKELGVSRRVLERVVAAHGVTASSVIRKRRARHAMQLIRSLPSARVEAIGKESGFPSPTAFRAAFVSLYGVTPRQAKTQLQRRSLPPAWPRDCSRKPRFEPGFSVLGERTPELPSPSVQSSGVCPNREEATVKFAYAAIAVRLTPKPCSVPSVASLLTWSGRVQAVVILSAPVMGFGPRSPHADSRVATLISWVDHAQQKSTSRHCTCRVAHEIN